MSTKYYILFLFISFPFYGQDCSMLKDGKYKIIYDGQTENFDEFELVGDKYFYKTNEIKKAHKIKLINNCSFEIINEDFVEDSNLTELQRLLKNQRVYFEIVSVEDKVYNFICRVNLHIQCGSGKFVRIK